MEGPVAPEDIVEAPEGLADMGEAPAAPVSEEWDTVPPDRPDPTDRPWAEECRQWVAGCGTGHPGKEDAAVACLR